jgi:hypothetical protein
MFKKNTLFIFIALTISFGCTPKLVSTGHVMDHRTDKEDFGYFYLDDTLNFSVSYWGYTKYAVSPDKKKIRKDVGTRRLKKIWDASDMTRYLVSLKTKFDSPPRCFLVGYQASKDQNLDKSRDRLYASLRNNSRVVAIDSALRDTSFKHDYRALKYTFKRKKQIIDVIEYHLQEKTGIIRFVFTMDRTKDLDNHLMTSRFLEKDAQMIMSTYKPNAVGNLRKDYEQNPFGMAVSERQKSSFNYLVPIYWLQQFSKQDTTDEGRREGAKNIIETYNSFIGIFNRERKVLPDSIHIPDHYVAVDARAAVLKAAARHQVIMLNEDHLDPYGRFFAQSLLDSLWQLGYRYVAAETLVHDPDLNTQAFIRQKAGFYSTEPCFGDFLRTAKRLGFQLVAYENDLPCDCTDRYCRINCRERNQASYLAQIFKTDPKAKVLVFAGHGHIYKKSKNPNVKWMAAHFRDSTGIAPFCIDQSHWITTPTSQRADSAGNPIKSLTLLDARTDTYWTPPGMEAAIDMEIIHPPTKYVDHYPDFLTHKGTHPVPIKLHGDQYTGALLRVFLYSEIREESHCIPLVNVLLRDKNNFYIYLPEGKFSLRAIDRHNIRLYENTFTVK